MLYKGNKEKALSKELFKNPGSEYRGAPFWSWNCKLSEEELLRQIEIFKEMGFGGYHMHVRSGMATRYLSDEFMNLIKSCVKKGEEEGLLPWLYDEDRWPSGQAGGFATKEFKNRMKYIVFTPALEDYVPFKEAVETGKNYLLATYDVVLNSDGTLKSYKMIDVDAVAEGKKWYALVKHHFGGGWHNDHGYVDSMSDEAMAGFINLTHEAYNREIGESFGKTVHAIFTDEPHFAGKQVLAFSKEPQALSLPWTYDFDETFNKMYGFSLIPHLPEVVWNLPENKPSYVRYCFHDHTAERFANAYAKQIGSWCDEHDISLTGHMLSESLLKTQTNTCGEVMRSLSHFGIPGIDMLCDLREYTTAKQAQSVKNQYGREAQVSELYGVTDWDCDFRTYKLSGDWQAALGVTVRVPHLSWVSMKGMAKRDYPATFNYQAPWYKEYPWVENYFARVNTALTKGKADVKVGVIHPVESAWLVYGPNDLSSDEMAKLEANFDNITEWLLFGQIDFDYISESLLPTQVKEGGCGLKVGEMEYDAIVLPALKTIRSTTLSILKDFARRGGKVIIAGDAPIYIDGQEKEGVSALTELSAKVDFNKIDILNALKEQRDIEVRKDDGSQADYYLYNMRTDGDIKYLFIANGRRAALYKKGNPIYRKIQRQNFRDTVESEGIRVKIKGHYKPVLLDALTGEMKECTYVAKDGYTVIPRTMYIYDSLLFMLTPAPEGEFKEDAASYEFIKEFTIREKVSYKRHEDNVLILDMATAKMGDMEITEPEEMLRLDTALRKPLGIRRADGCGTQPWVYPEDSKNEEVTLTFRVESEIDTPCRIAYEEMDSLTVNGEKIEIVKDGYFVDKDIHTAKIPMIKKGTNEIVITAPIGKRVSLENYFLIGDFGVELEGSVKTICENKEKISFGSITNHKMPFYGGNISYFAEFDAEEDGYVEFQANYYRGEFVKVILDGVDLGNIVIMPYKIMTEIKKGHHKVEFVLYGNRFNTFGALHNSSDEIWRDPGCYYAAGSNFTYDYMVKPTGIITSPIIRLYK